MGPEQGRRNLRARRSMVRVGEIGNARCAAPAEAERMPSRPVGGTKANRSVCTKCKRTGKRYFNGDATRATRRSNCHPSDRLRRLFRAAPLAEIDRHEDLRVVTLDQQRDAITRAGDHLLELIDARDRSTVDRQNYVARLD